MGCSMVLMVSLAACSETESGATGAALRLDGTEESLFGLMRWDRGRMPSRELTVLLSGRDAPPDCSLLEELAVELASNDSVNVRCGDGSGRFAISTPEHELARDIDITNANELQDAVLRAMAGVGAAADQAHLTVSSLNAAGGPQDEEHVVVSVARTVHVERTILGIGVSGDYASAAFELNGNLISMLGRWRQIDYGNSDLASDLASSEDAVFALAAQTLAQLRIDPTPTMHAIDVGTFYRLEQGAERPLWKARLCGYAALRDSNGNGTGGEGKIPTYEFFLDGSGTVPDALAGDR